MKEDFYKAIAEKKASNEEASTLILPNRSGKKCDVQLTSKNPYHIAIFQALTFGLNSSWFHELSDITKSNQILIVHPFVKWMSGIDKKRSPKNRYECLMDYDVYRKNEVGVKTSTVVRLKLLIEHGLSNPYLTKESVTFLENLLRLSNPPPDDEAQGYSLTQWFTQFNLRNSLGEKKFLSLESPRQLITSFRVTIAVTLSFLIEVRQNWNARESPKHKPKIIGRHWYPDWNRSILKIKGVFGSDGAPADILTSILLYDLVIERAHTAFSNFIRTNDIGNLTNNLNCKRLWQVPKLFTLDYDHFYSELEETLAAWLIASFAVQPSDVRKLKTSDFAIEYNSAGRPILMQIKYFKGRAGTIKETDVLTGSDCWTKALHEYIKNLPREGRIFEGDFNKSLQFPNLRSTEYNSRFGLLFRIWSIPEVRKRLDAEFSRSNVTSLFLDAMHAIKDVENIYTNRKSVAGSNQTKYIFLFRLAHIKTTAVHAQSDRYRDSDLINHHSHTSATEKISYLTDKNQEWVNQCGRVTRLVLHDLQNVVYRPSIEAIKDNVSSLISKSTLTQGVQFNKEDIKKINHPALTPMDSDDARQLIVADTEDTAIYFLHYIKQAETMFERLNRVRPDFVEMTLIVNVEWMTRMLSKMKSARIAESNYALLRNHLPPLFEYLLETIE
mgnify:CR=1 FL=1